MKTAVIYARVSTTRQADDKLSISSQLEAARGKAAELQAEVLTEFRDEGVSARTSKRPAFLRAIDLCATRHVDYFITWSTSRFARNRIDAATHKAMLKKYGTRLVYLASSHDPDSDDGWLPDVMLEVMDEYYSRSLARDTRRSMQANAAAGYFNGGRVPYGYHVIEAGRRRKLEPVPHEAGIVREIYERYLEGVGVKSLARELNERGLYRRSRRWDKDAVGRLLKAPIYAGELRYGEIAAHERDESLAIVDRATAEQVRAKFGQASGSESRPSRGAWVFTGILRCGACGSAMQIETATGRGGVRHSYYNCRAALKMGTCKSRRLRAPELDTWILDSVLQRIFTPARVAEILGELHELRGDWAVHRQAQIDALAAGIAETQRRMDRIFELFETHGRDTPNLGDLTRRLRAHRARLDEQEQDLRRIEAQEPPRHEFGAQDVEQATQFFRGIVADRSNAARTREFMTSLLASAVLHDDRLVLAYRPERLVSRTAEAVHIDGVRWLPDRAPIRTISVRLPAAWSRAA